jgi:hypothetical protein
MARQPLDSQATPADNNALARIPTAMQAKRSEPKRKRDWEKGHRSHSYRVPEKYRELVGVEDADEGIRKAIRALAEKHMTTTSRIADACMDFALSELRSGRLNITTRPNPAGTKMSIEWTAQDEGWPQIIPASKKKTAAVLKPKPVYLSYRWDPNVDTQVIAVAKQKAVPNGEVVVRLLQHALEAYQAGRLKLRETALVVKQKVDAVW